MREGFAGFLSVVAAATTPAAIFAAMIYAAGRPAASGAFLLAFIVSFGHALILGLPTALALKHKDAFRAVPMLLAGACVGLVPLSFLFFPYQQPRDWLAYLQLAASAAGLGATGGVAFYLTHRAISPNNSFKPTSLRDAA